MRDVPAGASDLYAGDAAPDVGMELSQDSLGSSPAGARVNVPSLSGVRVQRGLSGLRSRGSATSHVLCFIPTALYATPGCPAPIRGSPYCTGVSSHGSW